MSSATLMILGETLDPSVATKLLEMRPNQQWRRGDKKSFKRKDGSVLQFDSRHEWGGWKKWSSEAERKKELPLLLEHWCRKLMAKKKALARIHSSGSEIFLDCFVVGGRSEFTLPPHLLANLAGLGVALRVTFSCLEQEPNQSQRPRGSVARLECR